MGVNYHHFIRSTVLLLRLPLQLVPASGTLIQATVRSFVARPRLATDRGASVLGLCWVWVCVRIEEHVQLP